MLRGVLGEAIRVAIWVMNKDAGHAAILIAGPTASGKSALAIRLAQRLGGLVINADSMQVYRDLRIITARPSEAEERAAAHALFGTIDGATTHSVSLWLADATTCLARAATAGLVPIFVGGTGLYFKALTQGLSEIPPVPIGIREKVRAWAAAMGPGGLYDELARRDPETAARLRPTDPQRLTRALEVHVATGESLAGFQAKRTEPTLDITACVAINLDIERDLLRDRIERRFDAMMADGALDEVATLAARKLASDLPLMRAHGVPPLLRHLNGQLGLAEAVQQGKMDTRRYIKRQETFVRNQLPAFRPVAIDRAETSILRQFE